MSVVVTAYITGDIRDRAERGLIGEEEISAAHYKQVRDLKRALEDYEKWKREQGIYPVTQSGPFIEQSFEEYKKNKNAVIGRH